MNLQKPALALQLNSSMQMLSSHLILKTFALILSAQTLIACAPNGTSVHSAPNAAQIGTQTPSASGISNPPSRGGSSPTQAQGTGDLGGGNGLNGKVFESYTVDILKTPEYKNYLSQIDQHLESLIRTDDPEQRGIAITAFASRAKRWFIAPVSLRTLSKEKLGIDFAMDPVQQFALQNDNEIWIDKTILPKTEEERALLYLHEAVMNFYLFQFREMEISSSEPQKKDQSGMALEVDTKGFVDLMKAVWAPRPKRALNAQDYANVRAVTDYLWNHLGEVKSYDDMKKLFMRHGFDRRFLGEFDPIEFKNNEASRALPESTIDVKASVSGSDFLANMKQNSIAGRLPKFCDFDDIGNSRGTCSFKLGTVRELNDKFATLPLHFQAFDSQGKVRQSLKLVLVVPAQMTSYNTSLASGLRNSNVLSREVGFAYPVDEQGRVITDLKEGDIVWSISAHMTGTSSFQKLTGLQLTPHIVARTEKLLAPNDTLFNAVVPDNSLLKTELVVDQAQISGKPYINSSGPRGEARIFQGDLKQIRALQEKTSNLKNL